MKNEEKSKLKTIVTNLYQFKMIIEEISEEISNRLYDAQEKNSESERSLRLEEEENCIQGVEIDMDTLIDGLNNLIDGEL